MSILFSHFFAKNNEISPLEADFTEVLANIAVMPKTLYFHGKLPENVVFGSENLVSESKNFAPNSSQNPKKSENLVNFSQKSAENSEYLKSGAETSAANPEISEKVDQKAQNITKNPANAKNYADDLEKSGNLAKSSQKNAENSENSVKNSDFLENSTEKSNDSSQKTTKNSDFLEKAIKNPADTGGNPQVSAGKAKNCANDLEKSENLVNFSQKSAENSDIFDENRDFTEIFAKSYLGDNGFPEKAGGYAGSLSYSLRRPCLAVVGTRKPTPYGRQIAYELAYAAARRGAIIISGLAYGIDSIAHRAALDAGGITVAVLGTPIDEIYPRPHLELAVEIVKKGGAILSEIPAGAVKNQDYYPKTSFLKRNRLISGLSDVVMIPEAARRSGSLNTASHAIEQGKEIFAAPGNLNSPMSEGCNRLIAKGGAMPYLEIRDVMEVLFPEDYRISRQKNQFSFEDLTNFPQNSLKSGQNFTKKPENLQKSVKNPLKTSENVSELLKNGSRIAENLTKNHKKRENARKMPLEAQEEPSKQPANLDRRPTPLQGDTPIETQILASLGEGLSDGAEICTQNRLTISDFGQAITMLEIKGQVRSLGMNRWALR